jgi:tRNA threonylcarbamoyladenosine biosynthesis protein TsaE
MAKRRLGIQELEYAMQIASHSIAETLELGRRLGSAAQRGQVMALSGSLGAGKTHLVRGIAAGAQVADQGLVSSPTYVLLNIYPADPANPHSKPVYHLDAYRISNADSFAAVGFDELLLEEGIVALEWAERVPELLPEDHLRIDISRVDVNTRIFNLIATGPQSEALLLQFQA